jgi:hypothetical protein
MGDPPSNNSTSSEIVKPGNFVRYKNMECKAMRTILFIACSYAICWVPYLVCAMKEILGQSISYNLSSFTVIMVFLNTSIDPLIYAFMNRIMRFEIYKFYCDSTEVSTLECTSAHVFNLFGDNVLIISLFVCNSTGVRSISRFPTPLDISS